MSGPRILDWHLSDLAPEAFKHLRDFKEPE